MSAPPTPVIQPRGQLVLRFREPLFLLCYLAGFLAPWERSGGHATLWLVASTWAARSGRLSVATATVTVTFIAFACLALGAILRVRGTAHLGGSVLRAGALESGLLVTAGPYGPVRNPLYLGSYLGSWILALGTSILMPPSGAAFFIILFSLLCWFLILLEEGFLQAGSVDVDSRYRSRVPRLLSRIHTRDFISQVGPQRSRPQWLEAVLAETFPVTFTTCFAIFAWRYNARILMECLLICYGVSLLVRGVANPSTRVKEFAIPEVASSEESSKQ